VRGYYVVSLFASRKETLILALIGIVGYEPVGEQSYIQWISCEPELCSVTRQRIHKKKTQHMLCALLRSGLCELVNALNLLVVSNCV
jgi:hypothetical protein